MRSIMCETRWRLNFFFISIIINSSCSLPSPWGNWGPWGSWDRCRTTSIRKEWGELEPAERIAFTDAEICLQRTPSRLDPIYNSRSYYDDFVAVHINQTLGVHDDGVFLPWHREFIHLFEQALQQECGYTGTLPYWDWPLWASSLSTSPLFDGSASSLSGDGFPEGNQTYHINENVIPHGSGGGCVMSGPFVDYTVIYGPFTFEDVFYFNGTLPPWTFKTTERCFNRDLNTYVATRATSQTVVDVLLASETFSDFNNQLDLRRNQNPDYGVHIGGHYSTGPVLQDLFASPADPVFWLHHAQLDRVWTQWQEAGHDWNRIYGDNAISGGNTTLDIPPSPNVTLDHVMNWNILGEEKAIRQVMDVQNYCYRYT